MSRVFQRHPNRDAQGFSLVEVGIALALIALVLVGLLGLLPSGMNSFNKAMDITVTSQIGQRILHDAEQAEFDALIDKAALPPDPEGLSYCPESFTFRAPRVKEPGWRYFDIQGTEVNPKQSGHLTDAEKRKVVYYVNVRIMPRAVIPTINEGGSQVAQITVQVARNPNHLDLPFMSTNASNADEPERNLIAAGRVPIYTFASLVGKNQGR
jgi:type II secretory pathway pseudopilin PulG